MKIAPVYSIVFAAVVFPALAGLPAPRAAAQETAPTELHFGHDDSLPPPKTLLFSLGIEKIIADAAAWKAIGVDGFFLENAASEW